MFVQDLLKKVPARLRRTPSPPPPYHWPISHTPSLWGRPSPPLPLGLRALLVEPVLPDIPPPWTTAGPVLQLCTVSVPLLLAAVAAESGLGVAGVCLLLRNPIGVFGSRSHIPVPL